MVKKCPSSSPLGLEDRGQKLRMASAVANNVTTSSSSNVSVAIRASGLNP